MKIISTINPNQPVTFRGVMSEIGLTFAGGFILWYLLYTRVFRERLPVYFIEEEIRWLFLFVILQISLIYICVTIYNIIQMFREYFPKKAKKEESKIKGMVENF
jgi:Trk-type K+ transport system membrane component